MSPQNAKLLLGITQRTPEWFAARKQLITASEALSFIPTASMKQFLPSHSRKVSPPFKSKATLVKEKLSEDTNHFQSPAMLWGTKYEPLAKRWYQKRMGVDIVDVGLMIHPKYPWLGASPDGITSKNVLLEIKCPHRRKLHQNIPTQYWVQVQIQLEVMDMARADYVECKFLKYEKADDFLGDWMIEDDAKMAYVQLEASNQHLTEKEVDWQTIDNEELILPPLEMSSPRDYVDWAITTAKQKTNDSDGEQLWKPIFCCVEDWNILPVDRDQHFFESIRPILELEWTKMNEARIQVSGSLANAA